VRTLKATFHDGGSARAQEVHLNCDQLSLRAYIFDGNGHRVLYQEGTVAGMLAPPDLLKKCGKPLADGTLMFGGTLAALGGIRPSRRFEYEIEDTVLGRTLSHGYDIVDLSAQE
jgi:hypothetical protein